MSTDINNLPALSIRQPWAWLILHAGKDIENRCWPTRFRGPFLIHAAKGCTQAELEAAVDFARHAVSEEPLDLDRITVPSLTQLDRGGIVGMAEIVDCVSDENAPASPWFVGEYGFVLRNVRPLPFIPCKGALGFFKPVIASP